MKQHWAYHLGTFLFIICISIPLIFPYFYSGYFTTHDGEWAVVRLTDMFRELKDRQFPPRYSGNLNFGYGYPLFNFAYPFPYYLGILFHFFRFSFVDVVKILFAISVPLSGIGMFFASKTIWKSTLAGLISATLFLYLPYRLVDLYVRGSLGESIAFIFFPWLFFSVYRLIETGERKWIGIVAFIYAGLILTHNIMAVYFSLLLAFFIFGLLCFKKRENIGKVILAICGGLGISAFFLLPALIEKQYIFLSKVPIADRNLYYVSFLQLFTSPWGYGIPTDSNAFTYQLGLPHVFTGITVLFLLGRLLFIKKQSYNQLKILIIIFISIFMSFSLLLFSFSSFIWKLPLLSEINYPWTLLGPLGFLLCLISGFTAKEKYAAYIGGILTVLAIFLFAPYARPERYVNRGDDFYITNDATTTSSHEYMPLWVKQIPLKRPEKKVVIQKGEGTIRNIQYSSNNILFSADLKEKSYLRVNTIYYPGWEGKDVVILYNNNSGVMEFWLEKGKHAITLTFRETPIRLLSDGISISSFFLCIIPFLLKKKIESRV